MAALLEAAGIARRRRSDSRGRCSSAMHDATTARSCARGLPPRSAPTKSARRGLQRSDANYPSLRYCGQNRHSAAGTISRVQFGIRSEEHTSELQSLMRLSYAVFCFQKKKKKNIYK